MKLSAVLSTPSFDEVHEYESVELSGSYDSELNTTVSPLANTGQGISIIAIGGWSIVVVVVGLTLVVVEDDVVVEEDVVVGIDVVVVSGTVVVVSIVVVVLDDVVVEDVVVVSIVVVVVGICTLPNLTSVRKPPTSMLTS